MGLLLTLGRTLIHVTGGVDKIEELEEKEVLFIIEVMYIFVKAFFLKNLLRLVELVGARRQRVCG